MLAAIDLDNQTPIEAHKIKNEALKRNLASKFELQETPVAQQSPHRCFNVRWLATHLLCELSDAFCSGSMVRRLRHETPHPARISLRSFWSSRDDG